MIQWVTEFNNDSCSSMLQQTIPSKVVNSRSLSIMITVVVSVDILSLSVGSSIVIVIVNVSLYSNMLSSNTEMLNKTVCVPANNTTLYGPDL